MGRFRLFACALAAVVAASASQGSAFLLKNGSFEFCVDGALEGWSNLRSPLSVAPSSGRNGGTALVFSAESKPEHVVLNQTLPAVPGRSYRAAVWAKTENLVGGRAMVCIEWYNEAGRWIGGVYSQGIRGTKDWTEINVVASRLPETAKTFRIGVYVERGGYGRAWFDDVSLMPVETPIVAGLYSNAYRNRAADGLVTFFADLNLSVAGIGEKEAVACFTLPFSSGRKTVLADSISNSWASVTVDARRLESGQVDFRLKNSRGERIGSAMLTFEKLDRESVKGVWIDRHNRLIVDGKPFFPLGMYFGKVTAKDLDIYAKGPFNCLMPYAQVGQKELDLCAVHGMKAFCNIKDYYTFVNRKGAGFRSREENDIAVSKIVNGLKDHPALMGWYLNDEIPPAHIPELTSRYRLVKSLDAEHPAWTMLYQVKQTREYLPSFDIGGSDPYPHDDWKRWSDAYTWPKEQKLGTFGARPLWQAVQAHDPAAYMTGSREKMLKTHAPSEEEIRNLAWQALAAGANGLFFYSFFDLQKVSWKTPFEESFGAVCKVASEIKHYEHVFLSTESVAAESDTSHLGVRAWRHDGAIYLAVVNLRAASSSGRIHIQEDNGQCETLLGTPPSSGLRFDLVPFGVSFVRLTPRAIAPKTVYLMPESPASITEKDFADGGAEWPLVNITLPEEMRDFRGYDRLSVDFLSETADVGARMRCYLTNANKPVNRGASPGAGMVPKRGFNRWEIPLEGISRRTDPQAVAQIQFWLWRARACKISFFRMTLVPKGAESPPPDESYMEKHIRPFEMHLFAERDCKKSSRRIERRESARRYRTACVKAGQTGAFCLGTATAMENIRPREGAFPSVAKNLSIRLAQGEKESVQVFVTPKDGLLKNVRMKVSALKTVDGKVFPSSRVEVSVLGYVNITNPPPYGCGVNVPDASSPVGYVRRTEGCEDGWWPDPILSFMDSADVVGDDVQGFWIRVDAPRDQAAGIYRGSVTVSADGVESVRIPFLVRVNRFSVPATPILPLAITFDPKSYVTKGSHTPVAQWRRHRYAWADFLADRYISFDSLYRRDDAFPEFDMLERQRMRGLEGRFNLGYWTLPPEDEAGRAAWCNATIPRLKRAYDKAKALGIAHRAYIYGCDELNKDAFKRMKWAVEQLHRELPGVPVSTTAFDGRYGVGTDLSCIDWFTPQTDHFDPVQAKKARAEGRQVWWYFACDQKSPSANSFIECPAIEMRSVMGAQAVKFRPDGFLYYQLSLWNARRPIMSGPFTDWDPATWISYHGDGSWVCCGPDGIPLSTVRLENFADGLEDFAYARILEAMVADDPDASWTKEARRLLSVPASLVSSVRSFSMGPEVLLAWRDGMADLIEKWSKWE